MADVTNRIPGSRTEVVDVDETITIGRSRSATVQRDDRETVIASKTLAVVRKLTLQIAEEIEIIVGQARRLLNKDGTIFTTGRDVVIDSSGAVNIKASRDVVLKGKKILEN